jgi:ABC-type lipoprotein release transport system permease subunit
LNYRGGDVEIFRNNRSDMFRIMGDTPQYLRIEPLTGVSGRFINNKDLKERRKVVTLALIILIISGAIAGFLPARRAIAIKPIDALRAEI